jgi:hypothetical protein
VRKTTNAYKVTVLKLESRNHSRDLDVDRKAVFIWILVLNTVKLQIGFNWLR